MPPVVKLWREPEADSVHISIQYESGHYTRLVLDELTYLSLAACVMSDMRDAVRDRNIEAVNGSPV